MTRILSLPARGLKTGIQGKFSYSSSAKSLIWLTHHLGEVRCACDIPAHNYTFTFEPKRDWSSTYASAPEIKQYFNDFTDKYGLRGYIKPLHEVVGARWNDDAGTWSVEIENLTSGVTVTETCDIIINASGYLNKWTLPDIPGLKEYKGILLHSAKWDETFDLRDKSVALIGNGSSGVQILPAIQPTVRNLTVFIRSPTWILPPIGAGQHIYTPREIEEFTNNPAALMALRKGNERVVNSFFSLYLRDSPLQEELKTQVKKEMKSRLQDEAMEGKLIPSWGLGCRRLTAGPSYLESLCKDNVQVVHGGVVGLTEQGCKCDDGKIYPVEVVICATGFDTSFRPRFPMIGMGGLNLQDEWADKPKSYLGIGAAHFPNLFFLLGPHSPIANGPLLPALETQTDHILALIDRWQTENIHSFSPKPAAVEDFLEHTEAFMKNTVWTDECRSGYKNHTVQGRTPSLWPGSSLHCVEALKDLRADDWHIRYRGNRFAWLGDGFSQAELDPTCDLGYYLKDHDDSPYSSRSKRREMSTKSGSMPPRALFKVQRPD
ncbi:MAG: hypothetical protein M1837_007390 [Sclerophora amabilis]|nr:MAG: hypothetical protein M1837_007390 [Sclerophora amabilis]